MNSPVRSAANVRGRAIRIGLVGCVVALNAIPAALAAGRMVMRSTNNAKYGRILEGPARYTLYVFCAGTSTRCAGTRSSSWSPLIARGRVVPASGSHIKAGKLGSRRLSDGKRQVTYYGQPLYLYKGDKRPGKTNGEEKTNARGAWFVVSTTGRAVAKPGY